jgi:lysophospholipase L1-like esterase
MGKRIWWLFFAAIFLGGCLRTDIVNIDSKGKNIICFGDSITQGFGEPPSNAYPVALAQLANMPVINAGIEGDTSAEALKRFKTDVLDKEPLLVIIEFCGNDFLTKLPLEETVKNIETMITLAQAQGAMVAVVDIGGGVGPFAEYSREFKLLSRKMKTLYVPDILNGIITNPDLKSDYMHPNARGYRIVAHRVYRAIFPYLNQNVILNKFKK